MCIKLTANTYNIDDTTGRGRGKCRNLTVAKWKVNNLTLQKLLFADNVILIAETEAKL